MPLNLPLIYFISILVFWHLFEFFSQGIIHKKFSSRNFLVTVPYLTALFIGVLEYILGWYFFASYKQMFVNTTFLTGLFLVATGQIIRIMAIIQGNKSFTHVIQTQKKEEHTFVQNGIYSFCRHPAYLGWYIWAPATQILLANPISFVIYIIWGWLFLSKRIKLEEQYLVNFFGTKYIDYTKKVPVRIPFIK